MSNNYFNDMIYNYLYIFIFTLLLFSFNNGFAQNPLLLSPDSLNIVNTGESLVVQLEEAGIDEGYHWHYTCLDSNTHTTIQKIAETLHTQNGQTYRVFEFHSTQKGKVILFFEKYKDWEGSSSSINQLSFPVLIKDNHSEVKEIIAYRNIEKPLNKVENKIDKTHKPQLSNTYLFHEGQSFMIDLEADSKGIFWIPEIGNSDIVKLIEDRIQPKENSTIHTFKFLAINVGFSEIKFRLMLPSGGFSETTSLKYRIMVEPITPVTAEKEGN